MNIYINHMNEWVGNGSAKRIMAEIDKLEIRAHSIPIEEVRCHDK